MGCFFEWFLFFQIGSRFVGPGFCSVAFDGLWVQGGSKNGFGNWLLFTQLFSVQTLLSCEVGRAHQVACCRKRRVHIHRQKALGHSSLRHISDCRTRKYLHLCTNMYSFSTDHAPHVTDTLWTARIRKSHFQTRCQHQDMCGVRFFKHGVAMVRNRSVLHLDNVKIQALNRSYLGPAWPSKTQSKDLKEQPFIEMKSARLALQIGACEFVCGDKHALAIDKSSETNVNAQRRMCRPVLLPLNTKMCRMTAYACSRCTFVSSRTQ